MARLHAQYVPAQATGQDESGKHERQQLDGAWHRNENYVIPLTVASRGEAVHRAGPMYVVHPATQNSCLDPRGSTSDNRSWRRPPRALSRCPPPRRVRPGPMSSSLGCGELSDRWRVVEVGQEPSFLFGDAYDDGGSRLQPKSVWHSRWRLRSCRRRGNRFLLLIAGRSLWTHGDPHRPDEHRRTAGRGSLICPSRNAGFGERPLDTLDRDGRPTRRAVVRPHPHRASRPAVALCGHRCCAWRFIRVSAGVLDCDCQVSSIAVARRLRIARKRQVGVPSRRAAHFFT